MKQVSVIITLGIIHIIILSLFGMYFYRLKHSEVNNPPVTESKNTSLTNN